MYTYSFFVTCLLLQAITFMKINIRQTKTISYKRETESTTKTMAVYSNEIMFNEHFQYLLNHDVANFWKPHQLQMQTLI